MFSTALDCGNENALTYCFVPDTENVPLATKENILRIISRFHKVKIIASVLRAKVTEKVDCDYGQK